MSPVGEIVWTIVWTGTLLAVLAALGGCTTVTAGATAAQQVRLPAPPASLSKTCSPPAPVASGDDLRKSLDAVILWGDCSSAEVAAWQAFYSGLRK